MQNNLNHDIRIGELDYKTTNNLDPIVFHLKKHQNGFGLHVKGKIDDGGECRSINGTLYLPMQQISSVNSCGSAAEAGLKQGDRILEVNGINVEGKPHCDVVNLIRNSGDELFLTIVREVPVASLTKWPKETSLKLSIPSYTETQSDTEKFTVYDIFRGTFLVSRRYKEFCELHKYLTAKYPDLNLLKLPMKWPFGPSNAFLEQRRSCLEQYIQKMYSFSKLRDNEKVMKFLNIKESTETNKNSEINSNVDNLA